jgi:hypothetical protein
VVLVALVAAVLVARPPFFTTDASSSSFSSILSSGSWAPGGDWDWLARDEERFSLSRGEAWTVTFHALPHRNTV